MILSLSVDDRQFSLVRTGLQNIRPEMLLFTRRIREIQISLLPHLSTNAPAEDNLYKVVAEDLGVFSVRKLNSQLEVIGNFRYFRQELDVLDMPHHSKRQKEQKSQIVLAFPFDENGPIVDEQQLFAFLPFKKIRLSVLALCY
jgi:hypothetical protein